MRKFYLDGNFQAIHKIAYQRKGFSRAYGFGKLSVFSENIESIHDENRKDLCLAIIVNVGEYLLFKTKNTDFTDGNFDKHRMS